MANRAEQGTSVCAGHGQAPGKLAPMGNRQRHAGPLAARLGSPDKLGIWALMLRLSQLSRGFLSLAAAGKENPSFFTRMWFEIFLLCSARTMKIISDEEGRK